MPEYLSPGVYVIEEQSGINPIEGVGTSTACFVGAAARGRPFYPTYITSWTDFERSFGPLTKSADMPLGVYHFFLNGGKKAYIIRLLDLEAPEGKAAVGTASFPTDGGDPALIEAAGAGAWSKTMSVEIRLSSAGRNPWNPAPNSDGPVLFDVVVLDNVDGQDYELERIARVGVKEDGERFYATIINRDSRYIKVVLADPEKNPDFPEKNFALDEADENGRKVRKKSVALAGGEDGDPNSVFSAAVVDKALATLDKIDDINILAIPGQFEKEVVSAGVSYVAKRADLIYVIDSVGNPRNNTSGDLQMDKVRDQFAQLPVKDSHAALYFPWIEIADPYSRVAGATRFAPPSGAIAGLYARTDNRRGVWKAPAGTEASILGAVGLAVNVTDNDQESLNPIGVNCIRQFPDSGIVCWGSRTIATRSKPEYRYVPIRRYAMFLAKSLYHGTQWVVFEPNDEPLWSAIRFNLNAFMLRQFRSGALQGGKPEEAYFIKCDKENNPQASIDAGEVHITVGFSPLKPAEFVIIHLTQMRKE